MLYTDIEIQYAFRKYHVILINIFQKHNSCYEFDVNNNNFKKIKSYRIILYIIQHF